MTDYYFIVLIISQVDVNSQENLKRQSADMRTKPGYNRLFVTGGFQS